MNKVETRSYLGSSMMPGSTSDRRIVVAVLASLLAVAVAAGGATAHNPACHQVAGPDGPHYDDDPQTGSETAYGMNPNLGGSDNPANSIGENDDRPANAADGCSRGNSQSSDGGH